MLSGDSFARHGICCNTVLAPCRLIWRAARAAIPRAAWYRRAGDMARARSRSSAGLRAELALLIIDRGCDGVSRMFEISSRQNNRDKMSSM